VGSGERDYAKAWAWQVRNSVRTFPAHYRDPAGLMADLGVGDDFPEEKGDPLPPWRTPEANRLPESSSESEPLVAPVKHSKTSDQTSTDSMFPDSGDEMLFDGQ
jgi:hypothetical protein